VVICLERGADLHMAQLMPLPLSSFASVKSRLGVTFLVPAYPDSPGQRAVKRVYVCMYVERQSDAVVTLLQHLSDYDCCNV